ncbi:MAG: phage head-tail connector protein [Alphaproteobacteria bacterium]
MRSIVTVISANSTRDLTTLARVKAELAITGTSLDTVLGYLITSVSRAAESYLGRTLRRETLSETFRLDGADRCEALVLDRRPVSSITSVTVDSVSQDAATWELDGGSGLLYRLCDDRRAVWSSCQKIVVVYVAGYYMPGQTARDLPEDIEQGAIAWLRNLNAARGRDPMLKREVVPQVYEAEYWIGAQGTVGEPPPEAVALLAKHRRP